MPPHKILIAEDDTDTVTILQHFLEHKGYTVTVARDGAEAEARLKEQSFDLALLDIMMPKKDGWALCKMIKADPRTRALPVIVLTAKAQECDEKASLDCGADAFITKPFNFEDLTFSIDKYLPRPR
jgi:DNA-binding response OmpR family regulator